MTPDIDSVEGVEPSLAFLAGGEATASCGNLGMAKLSSSANGNSGGIALASATANAVTGGRGAGRARLAAVMTLGNSSPRDSMDEEGPRAVVGGRSGSSSELERSGLGSASGWSWLRAGIKAAVAHGSSKEKDSGQTASSRGRKRPFGLGK